MMRRRDEEDQDDGGDGGQPRDLPVHLGGGRRRRRVRTMSSPTLPPSFLRDPATPPPATPPPTSRPSLSGRSSSSFFALANNRCPALGVVFLSGAVVALSSILIADYLRASSFSAREAQLKRQALFPDPGHLTVFEEHLPQPVVSSSTQQSSEDFPQTELQQKKPSQVQSYKECEAEALQTLHAAVHSKPGSDRARKLFDHAVNLCPNHPKILLHYGEFLEATDRDLVQADHMFARAMAFSEAESEEHVRALQNRKRTASMVEELDRRTLKRVDDKKKRFQKISEGSTSLRRAKREAYFQHIYHTVGIEGNTMTLAQTRSILETKLAVGGKSVVEHNEVLGMDAALRYINQTLVDRVGEISLQDILEIHKRVIGYVDPLEAGMLRNTQVFVGDYIPPHPSHIDVLMQKFVLWLNSPENFDLHPIHFAALAHYKLVYIHPFVDGNGRTSRLLMNLILMQSGFPPVIIRKQDRLHYYKHLVTANEGDVRPFIRFIAECTERTLDAYVAAAQELPLATGGKQQYHGLMAFADESEMTITPQDRLDYHEAVIMGGSLGDNLTVEQP